VRLPNINQNIYNNVFLCLVFKLSSQSTTPSFLNSENTPYFA